MAITVCHADHGVSSEVIAWALAEIAPTGFFLRTLELPAQFEDLENALHGPVCGDEPVPETEVCYFRRSEDRPPSRFTRRDVRPTRLVTLIGIVDGENVTVFTAHGGPAAFREVGDASLVGDEVATFASAEFWATHALSIPAASWEVAEG
jgi:hypothetical protein